MFVLAALYMLCQAPYWMYLGPLTTLLFQRHKSGL